jgi:hypothetical protein
MAWRGLSVRLTATQPSRRVDHAHQDFTLYDPGNGKYFMHPAGTDFSHDRPYTTGTPSTPRSSAPVGPGTSGSSTDDTDIHDTRLDHPSVDHAGADDSGTDDTGG